MEKKSMSCQGKKIIVTGGAAGYGYGIAKKLKAKGAKVIITGRRLEMLEKAAKELGVDFVQADVSKGEDWDRVFAAAGDKVDVLINNAGAAITMKTLAEFTDEEIMACISTNLTGVLLGCKRAAKTMVRQGAGLIINVSSVCAHYGWPNLVAYTAGKAGLDKMSRALYTELRPHNIRVTVLTPSWGDTDFSVAAGGNVKAPELRAKIMTPDQMGDLTVQICELPENLVMPEVMVQPVVQEIIPF